ncbi:uncharacterized protein LOC107361470 [Tetranychus urticae]|uniref:uncharacterized protein LOC107361470 n=1 Tax=Tetranychus urticae TaxID=32264 RepID=UPI00077B8593|nr:uncharacterized protein LOC107361470 [Tetranychus urticae]
MEKVEEKCADELKIVNRRREYTVSKKLICSTVPYFEKMFCCDLLESKENKVELDFDEHVFDSILDWIHSEAFTIKVDYVISFYDAADYLMINDRLFEPCLSYFHENFTIRHLPSVLLQVTKVSKLLNSGSIESFICHHFLKIANTDAYLDYPVESVEAILTLDLMVYSEYQIFESIIKWINGKVDSRKKYILKLMDCVRWFNMDRDDRKKMLDNELIKTRSNFDLYSLAKDSDRFNRSKQSFFISIHQKADATLALKAFDNEMFCFTIGDFSQDDSMSLEFVHGEHTSDILFDSGAKGIRIDWVKKTFRWLDFKVAGNTYYSKLAKFIVKFPCSPSDIDCYLEDKDAKFSIPIAPHERLLLESNGKFILIGKTRDEKKWFGIFPVKCSSWFNNYSDHEHSFKATVLDDVVYILTKDLEFIQFNYKTRSFDKSKPFKDEKLDFNDSILTSHQTGDSKIFLVNKSSGKIHTFCNEQKEWSESYRFMNVNLSSNSSNISKLITFTSAFLPIKNITPLYKQALLL